MKTPEEMALEYAEDWHKDCDYPAEILRHTKKATETVFLAGYQAAKDEDKAKLQNLEANWKFCCEDKNRLIKELAATERALDKVTDADKVMCNTTMEEIKDVDTGELMPITYSTPQSQWISVKERLPEDYVGWTTVYGCILSRWGVQPGFYTKDNGIWISRFVEEDEGSQNYVKFESVTHWMPLPEPPRETE